MKITVDLPSWVDERNIRIFAGVELVAFKLAADNFFHVKSSRCSHCGDCCKGLSKFWHHGLNEEGNCKHLISKDGKFLCGLDEVPFSCIGGKQEKGKWKNTNCSIEYDEVPI